MKLAVDPVQDSSDHRTIRELVRDLRDDAINLLRQEFQLFGAELRESAGKVGKHGLMLTIGALVLFLAMQVVIVTACVGLSMLLAQAMPMTGAIVLGPLIVGAVLAISGWLAFRHGFDRLKHADVWPHRTVDAWRETKEWLRDDGAES